MFGRARLGIALSCLACVSILSGCASQSGQTKSAAHPPRSAQYTMALDWSYPLSPKTTFYLGAMPLELGNLTSVGDVVYVGSSLGKVAAIHSPSARSIWIRELEAPVSAGPVVLGNALFVALGSGDIIRLDAKSGEEVWRYSTGVPIEQSLTVADGVVACVNGNNRVFVLDAQTGALRWRRERPRSKEFTLYGQAPPLIAGGVLYAGFSDGFLVAYALENGTMLWSRDLAPQARFKDLDVKPVIVDNVLYVATSSGGLYALSVADGQTLWHQNLFGISSINAFQDSLYVSSQSGVFRLNRQTGETIWQNEIQKDVLISALQLGRVYIYASVQRFGLVVIDRVSGHTRHVIDMGSDFTSAPVLTPGYLTVLSNRSTVYRFVIDDVPL
ncbi:MAG: PQQ-binding-like beta-propeller repeat protein [Proteobacteria bacterium]|nr:PQQ-binding-like beta-propeller repeat protein [Pseudomonadota bacterium]